jgi:hypothetical protein
MQSASAESASRSGRSRAHLPACAGRCWRGAPSSGRTPAPGSPGGLRSAVHGALTPTRTRSPLLPRRSSQVAIHAERVRRPPVIDVMKRRRQALPEPARWCRRRRAPGPEPRRGRIDLLEQRRLDGPPPRLRAGTGPDDPACERRSGPRPTRCPNPCHAGPLRAGRDSTRRRPRRSRPRSARGRPGPARELLVAARRPARSRNPALRRPTASPLPHSRAMATAVRSSVRIRIERGRERDDRRALGACGNSSAGTERQRNTRLV